MQNISLKQYIKDKAMLLVENIPTFVAFELIKIIVAV